MILQLKPSEHIQNLKISLRHLKLRKQFYARSLLDHAYLEDVQQAERELRKAMDYLQMVRSARVQAPSKLAELDAEEKVLLGRLKQAYIDQMLEDRKPATPARSVDAEEKLTPFQRLGIPILMKQGKTENEARAIFGLPAKESAA